MLLLLFIGFLKSLIFHKNKSTIKNGKIPKYKIPKNEQGFYCWTLSQINE